MASQLLSAGTQWAFFGFVSLTNAYNLLLGNSASDLTDGIGRPMYHLKGIREAGTGFGEDEAVTVDGDDGSLGSIDFENAAPRRFIFELGIQNLDIEAAMQSTSVQTYGNIQIGARDVKNTTYPDGCLIIQSKSKDAANNGASAWNALVYPRLTVKPLGAATRTSRTAFYQRFSATAQPVMNAPWGVTTSDEVGACEVYAMPIKANYPVTMEAFQLASGSSEDFTLGYTPISSSVDDNILFLDRTRILTDYTVTPGTKNLNVNTGSAGDRGVLLYHFDPSQC